MVIQEDRWLGNITGYPVFRLENLPPFGHPEVAKIPGIAARHEARQSTAMYYVKVDTSRIDLVQQFSTAGWYVVDVNVTFNLSSRSCVAPSMPAGIMVEHLNPGYSEAILAIAGSCFKYSRFHLDPLIPDSLAHRIKHDWILSYVRGQRGERLLVALLEGRPAGFLAALASEQAGKRVRIIDLVGVAQEYQGQGIGKALVGAFINLYKDKCDGLQVGTQAANIPSMLLYQKCGFTISQTNYVMHRHIGSRVP